MKFYRLWCSLISGWLVFSFVGFFVHAAIAGPQEKIESSERCTVCGMFVAKYPNWVTQLCYVDGSVKFFDGTKDLMAHYFDPASFGLARRGDNRFHAASAGHGKPLPRRIRGVGPRRRRAGGV